MHLSPVAPLPLRALVQTLPRLTTLKRLVALRMLRQKKRWKISPLTLFSPVVRCWLLVFWLPLRPAGGISVVAVVLGNVVPSALLLRRL